MLGFLAAESAAALVQQQKAKAKQKQRGESVGTVQAKFIDNTKDDLYIVIEVEELKYLLEVFLLFQSLGAPTSSKNWSYSVNLFVAQKRSTELSI